MPWNITGSIQGSRYGSSAPASLDNRGSYRSAGHPSSISRGYDGEVNLAGSSRVLNQRGSRLMSASPLAGRGSGISGRNNLSLDNGGDEDRDALSDTNLDNYLGSDDNINNAYDSFQVHGPAAEVDTQTAAQSQWLASTLDRESLNFLDFLRARVGELKEKNNEDNDESDEKNEREISLSTLLPPEMNTRVVATQAFLHVLTLATKGAVRVSQEGTGDIFIKTMGQ